MGHLYVCWYLRRLRSGISDVSCRVWSGQLTTLEPKKRRNSASASRFFGSIDSRFLLISVALDSISRDEAYLNAMNPLDSDGPAVDAFA